MPAVGFNFGRQGILMAFALAFFLTTAAGQMQCKQDTRQQDYFGDTCQYTSMWDTHGGVCNELVANMPLCRGVVLAASLPEDHAHCLNSQGCQEWFKIKKLAKTVYNMEVADIALDSFAVLLVPLSIRDVRAASIALSIMSIAEVGLMSVVANAALNSKESLNSFITSNCWSVGSAYQVIVQLSDKVSSILSLEITAAIAAVLAASVEMVSLSEGNKGCVRVFCTICKVMFPIFELAISTVSFSANTLPWLEILKDTEAAVLGQSSLKNGFVCVSRNVVGSVNFSPTIDAGLPAGVTVAVLVVFIGAAWAFGFCLLSCR